MKRFMFLSIGVLCLAVAVLIGFYVGSQRAEAQAPQGTVYFVYLGSTTSYRAILPNGDIYKNFDAVGGGLYLPSAQYVGNFWGGTVSTDKSTWSGVKGQFNK